jgi:hypothetical protein
MADRLEELAEQLAEYNSLDVETIVTIARSISDVHNDSDEAAETFLENAVEAAKADSEGQTE